MNDTVPTVNFKEGAGICTDCEAEEAIGRYGDRPSVPAHSISHCPSAKAGQPSTTQLASIDVVPRQHAWVPAPF
jgi:hypothetical protein